MQSTVSVRGQTTIPAELRKKFNIKANTKLLWLDNGETILVFPVPEDPIRAFRGKLKGVKLTELLIKERKLGELLDKR